MKTNHIKLRPDRLNAPLATCHVGKLSSAVFVVEGDIPDDIDTMNIEVERTPDPTTHEPRPNFTCACAEQEDGTWRCYLSPFVFPDLSDALCYHVVGQDNNSNPRWLGTGALVVKENPANGSPIVPPVIPHDAYAYNPTTGLYHKMTAAVDEYGNIHIEVEQEGVQR